MTVPAASDGPLSDAAALVADLCARDPRQATGAQIGQVRAAAQTLRSAAAAAERWADRAGHLLSLTYQDGVWSLRLDGTLVADHGGLHRNQEHDARAWAEQTIAGRYARPAAWTGQPGSGQHVALVITRERDKETTS